MPLPRPSDMTLVVALWTAFIGASVGAGIAIAIREHRRPFVPSVEVALPNASKPVLAEHQP